MPKIHSNQSISCLINGREKAGIKTLTTLKHSGHSNGEDTNSIAKNDVPERRGRSCKNWYLKFVECTMRKPWAALY